MTYPDPYTIASTDKVITVRFAQRCSLPLDSDLVLSYEKAIDALVETDKEVVFDFSDCERMTDEWIRFLARFLMDGEERIRVKGVPLVVWELADYIGLGDLFTDSDSRTG